MEDFLKWDPEFLQIWGSGDEWIEDLKGEFKNHLTAALSDRDWMRQVPTAQFIDKIFFKLQFWSYSFEVTQNIISFKLTNQVNVSACS